jgi:hypothetical protein
VAVAGGGGVVVVVVVAGCFGLQASVLQVL